MDNIEKVERLIQAINNIHLQYSKDYFESGKVEKINLSKTDVPTEHILRYRLNLHESINDYLLTQNLSNITYYYRVKTSESILDKISKYSKRFLSTGDKYPVNNWINDIFGARMILTAPQIELAVSLMDTFREKYGLKNWYLREKDEYRGLHIYFKNKSNFYFPWELQLWDEADISKNIESHRLNKRDFTNNVL